MKRSRWIKPFIRITSAAVLTSAISSGISFLLLSNYDGWGKNSGKEVAVPFALTQQDSLLHHSSKSAIYVEYRMDTIKPALQQSKREPELKTIQQAVKDAVDALAKHEPFAAWKGAHTEIQALGPGTHGWVVHITSSNHKRLGYLIIQATEEGNYSLTEYGTGEYYPFAKDTLKKAMQDLGWNADEQKLAAATPYYVKPLLAVWRLDLQSETHWIDACSGELLPDLSLMESSIQHASMPMRNAVSGVLFSLANNYDYVTNTPVIQSFDPYDQIGWMTDQALRWSGHNAQRKLQQWDPINSQEKLIYVQTLKVKSNTTPKMNFPYAVSGEQLWKIRTDDPAAANQKYRYVALTAPGSTEVRYIGDTLLLSNGYITASSVNLGQ